jgi:hypothetical protein
MTLIEGWQTAYKLYSVQLAALIALLALIQTQVLPAFQAQLEPSTYAAVNGLLAAVLGAARLIKQGPPAVG